MNENYPQPSLKPGVETDIMKGLYLFDTCGPENAPAKLRLLGSGAILREVIAAAGELAEKFGVHVEIFSATSFSELARDAADVERGRRAGGTPAAKRSHVEMLLPGTVTVIAATDYVRAYPQLIAPYVEGRFVALGTDGFGRSDTRSALRKFFEVDKNSIVLAGLEALTREGTIAFEQFADAVIAYDRNEKSPAPWTL